MSVNIPFDILNKAKLTPEEFLIEIAAHLYDLGRLTIEEAHKFANLDQAEFQKELVKRSILIKDELAGLNDSHSTSEALNNLELSADVKSLLGSVKVNEKELDYKEILADEKLKKYLNPQTLLQP